MSTPTAPTFSFPTDEAFVQAFGQVFDAVQSGLSAALGDRALRAGLGADGLARSCEAIGRLLLQFAFEPIGLSFGVLFLWMHKQLHAMQRADAVPEAGADSAAEPVTAQVVGTVRRPRGARWRRARQGLHAHLLAPVLAGFMVCKTALGSFLSARLHELDSAATIVFGPVGPAPARDDDDLADTTHAIGLAFA